MEKAKDKGKIAYTKRGGSDDKYDFPGQIECMIGRCPVQLTELSANEPQFPMFRPYPL
jgi:hypothetical protein